MDTWVEVQIATWQGVVRAARLPAVRNSLKQTWRGLTAQQQLDIIRRINDLNRVRDALQPLEDRQPELLGHLTASQLESDDLDYAREQARRETVEEYLASCNKLQTARQVVHDAIDALANVWPVTHHQITRDTLDEWMEIQAAVRDAHDATRRLMNRANSQNMRNKLIEARKSALSRTIVDGFSHLWVGGWELGSGSYGTVTLFVKGDRNRRIVDRVAVKDCHFTGLDADWNDVDLWSPHPTQQNVSVPNEVMAHYNLRDRVGSDKIVQIRNWRIRRRDRMYRLYLEYLPFGNVLRDFAVQSMARRSLPDDPYGWTPEALLWHSFECMAEGGLVMAHGGREPNPMHTWDGVIHRDLKAANMFRGLPRADRYRRFPSVKIGDFGLAVMMTPEKIQKRPRHIRALGTPGTRAPEQDHFRIAGHKHLARLSEKTNVFGVGLTMATMIKLAEPSQDSQPDGGRYASQATFTPLEASKYSAALIELIQECTAEDPDDRPTFRQIIKTIRYYTSGDANDQADDMRDAPSDDDDKWDKYKDLIDLTDDYRIGLALENLGSQNANPGLNDPSNLPDGWSEPSDDDDDDDDSAFGGSPGADIEFRLQSDSSEDNDEENDEDENDSDDDGDSQYGPDDDDENGDGYHGNDPSNENPDDELNNDPGHEPPKDPGEDLYNTSRSPPTRLDARIAEILRAGVSPADQRSPKRSLDDMDNLVDSDDNEVEEQEDEGENEGENEGEDEEEDEQGEEEREDDENELSDAGDDEDDDAPSPLKRQRSKPPQYGPMEDMESLYAKGTGAE